MSELKAPQIDGDRRAERLPEDLRPLFWDCDFDRLDPAAHDDFMIGRILATGPWKSICWLRQQMGDDALRAWIHRHDGRMLTPQQLRFWQLILDLPGDQVDRWLAERSQQGWDDRVRR